MRPEIKEYHFDWMLNSIISTAVKSTRCSEKEIKRMLPYMPYFKNILEALIGQGEAGINFLKLIGQYFENLMTAHKKGKKIAMTTFCFSPAILYAMDVVPLTLELVSAISGMMFKRGTFDYLDYCVEKGFTETSCSSQRGTLGAYLAGLGEDIDFIVIDSSGICDTNANAFSFASSYMNKPFYQLDYPSTLVGDRTKNYHRQDFKALIAFIEKQTGNKLDIERLRQILDEIAKQDELIAEIEEMQRLVPSPLPIVYNLFLYAGRFLCAGLPIYTDVLKSMVKTAKKNAQDGVSGLGEKKEKCRAFFFYIDHYSLNLNLWKWLDENGITHLGNILSRYFSDNVVYAKGREEEAYHINTTNLDTMIDSIAEMNARMPMVRTVRGPYDAPHMWLDDSLALAKLFKADCLIYNGTPGCRNTWANVKLIARDMEKQGYPTHLMYGDAFDDRVESWDATAARLDEFFKVRRLL